MSTISYQPWYTGATYPAWLIPLNNDGAADDITGVNLTLMTLTFRTSGGVDTLGTGTFTLAQANPAQVYYKPKPLDVAAAFSGTIIVKALFPPSNSSLDEVVYDPIPFVITAS